MFGLLVTAMHNVDRLQGISTIGKLYNNRIIIYSIGGFMILMAAFMNPLIALIGSAVFAIIIRLLGV